MAMTMAEKILARASGRDQVKAGQYVTARVDRMMAHEAFARCGLTLKRMGLKAFHDPDRVVIILDHYFPAPTVQMADVHVLIRGLAEEYRLKNYLGYPGICHQAMIEGGFVRPGELILGTDSHTTTYGALGAAGTGIGQTEMSYVLATGELWMMAPPTIRFELQGTSGAGLMSKDIVLYIAGRHGTEVAQYKAVEFGGEVAAGMSLAGRVTMSNMGVELGAKFAFFEADQKTSLFLEEMTGEGSGPFGPDPGAEYEAVHEITIDGLIPQVALPHNPGNVKPVNEIGEIVIQQAFLGSCTNGRLEDLRVAARILKNRKVHQKVRLLVTPASHRVLEQASEAGYIRELIKAGAHISPAGCGPCPGGHMGLLGVGESCISSTNRNFKGRMGNEASRLYLGSPATVAASAIEGRIADPRAYWNGTTLLE